MNSSAQWVRGSTVDPALRFTHQFRGTPVYDAFLEALDEEQRGLVHGAVDRKAWYPLESYAALVEVAAVTLAGDDPEAYLRAAGRYVFDDGVNTIYRAFFLIARPSFVIKGSALMWGMFFRGTRLNVRSGRTHAIATVEGGRYCNVPMCVSVAGGMERALEHAGARDVQLDKHSCRADTQRDCEFHFRWR